MYNEKVIILDIRFNYEHNISKFKNAITLDINKFYLKQLGFKNVYQLDMGLIKYRKENGKDFDGKCF